VVRSDLSCTLRGGDECHARKYNTAKNRPSRRLAPAGMRTTIGRGERQYFVVLDRVPSAVGVDLLPSRVRVDAVRYGAAVTLIAARHAARRPQPRHSCDSAGSADAAVATSMTLRATNENISLSPKCAPSFLGSRSGLGLRPARPPGLFFSRLWPRPWRPLFHPDPTSLSTSVDTGGRGASDRKPDDNARAKCGARECRQDQNHDHPLTSEKQQSSNPELCRST